MGHQPIKRIGVLPHTGKPPALHMAKQLIELLESRQIDVWLDEESAQLLQRSDLSGPMAGLDVGIVLGGDGAFLRAGRQLAIAGVPLIGVNYGHLGILTEVEPERIDWAVDRLMEGSYRIEVRFMLRAGICRQGEEHKQYYALNDIVVARGTLARIVQSHVYIGKSFVGVYRGDGVIVSSPTGSTAYSLSAGGPILHPGLDAVVITPICPHTLGARSIVTDPDDRIVIRFESANDELLLTIDGQLGDELQQGDEVWVERAAQRARLIRLHDRTFYDILHNRLSRQFGDDMQAAGELNDQWLR